MKTGLLGSTAANEREVGVTISNPPSSGTPERKCRSNYRRAVRQIIPAVAASMALASVTAPVSAATLTTLVDFDQTNGSYASAGLIADSAGNLYGTTRGGGAGNYGTVYRIDAATGTLSTLVAFDGSSAKGGDPAAGLTLDAAGNLYGTAFVGGQNGYGTVFRINSGTNALTTLASFDKANGSGPSGGVIMDKAGNLYGTTQGGGSGSYGTVFRIDAGSTTITTLASFDATNGASPVAGLITDKAGNLYGTTLSYGLHNGAYGTGTVFRIDAGSNALTTLANFNGPNGGSPFAGLVADAAGNLYGTTSGGGAGLAGTVFRIDAGTNSLTTLVTFDKMNGSTPEAGLIMDAAGNLYGTTTSGGTSAYGTVFRIDAATDSLTTLASFDGTNGGDPMAGLFADSAGNLYGTTYEGGAGGFGTVFEIRDSGFVIPSAPPTGPVPEPGTWAMMIGGFGMVGMANRRRRRSVTGLAGIGRGA